tara:strand:+ start:358 stop:1539 length:1182 start_codon:yes stop_codon:yes gene_type:complete
MQLNIKSFNNKIVLSLVILILNSYFLLSINLPIILLKINLILFFLVLTYFFLKHFKYNFPLKLYFLLFLIICLGSPAINWDFRSIYLFHTKRIFFDSFIYSVADNYASFSHNDYPLLVPAFSSSFAFLLGYWNEIFPKSAFTFMYLPPLIFLSSYLGIKKNIIFLSVLIFFIGQQLFNGGTDGIVSLYFITCSFCFYKIFFEKKNESIDFIFYILTFLFCICLTLIKNEGLALLFVIFVTTTLFVLIDKSFMIHLKKILILSISFLPMLLWKLFCYNNNISNDYVNLNLFDQVLPRLLDIENYVLFFHYFFLSNEKAIIAIVAFLICFYINFDKRLFRYSLALFLLYLFIILIVHFSTPLDFIHQLETSSFRIIKTFTLLLGFFSVYNLKTYS